MRKYQAANPKEEALKEFLTLLILDELEDRELVKKEFDEEGNQKWKITEKGEFYVLD